MVNKTAARVCAWAGVVMIATFCVSFIYIANMIPPVPLSWTADQVPPGGAIQVTAEYSEDIVTGAGWVCYPHGWIHKGGWRRASVADSATSMKSSSTDSVGRTFYRA